jgi:hypothetical protein
MTFKMGYRKEAASFNGIGAKKTCFVRAAKSRQKELYDIQSNFVLTE